MLDFSRNKKGLETGWNINCSVRNMEVSADQYELKIIRKDIFAAERTDAKQVFGVNRSLECSMKVIYKWMPQEWAGTQN